MHSLCDLPWGGRWGWQKEFHNLQTQDMGYRNFPVPHIFVYARKHPFSALFREQKYEKGVEKGERVV